MTATEVEPVTLANPGFEDQEPGVTPAGWTHTGAVEAVKLDENGHSGNLRLGGTPCEVGSALTEGKMRSTWR
jgi:hypothetical protein